MEQLNEIWEFIKSGQLAAVAPQIFKAAQTIGEYSKLVHYAGTNTPIPDRFLITNILGTGICAIAEAYRAYELSQLLKQAKNLVGKTQEELNRIITDLEQIPEHINRLDEALATLIRPEIPQADFERAKARAERCMYIINEKVDNFLDEINDLHVEINGVRERLRSATKTAMLDSWTGLFGGLTGVCGAVLSAGLAHPALVVTQGLIGASRIVIAAVNSDQVNISTKQLEEIRVQVEQIEALKQKAKEFKKHASAQGLRMYEVAEDRAYRP